MPCPSSAAATAASLSPVVVTSVFSLSFIPIAYAALVLTALTIAFVSSCITAYKARQSGNGNGGSGNNAEVHYSPSRFASMMSNSNNNNVNADANTSNSNSACCGSFRGRRLVTRSPANALGLGVELVREERPPRCCASCGCLHRARARSAAVACLFFCCQQPRCVHT